MRLGIKNRCLTAQHLNKRLDVEEVDNAIKIDIAQKRHATVLQHYDVVVYTGSCHGQIEVEVAIQIIVRSRKRVGIANLLKAGGLPKAHIALIG